MSERADPQPALREAHGWSARYQARTGKVSSTLNNTLNRTEQARDGREEEQSRAELFAACPRGIFLEVREFVSPPPPPSIS